MYRPRQFEETRLDVLHALMRAHPLGALVTLAADGLHANHLPFEIVAPTLEAPFGTLRAHAARANGEWRAALPDADALVIFQGPSAYITPSWYKEKAVSGKVVPTYDYAVVHAGGPLRLIEDTGWLRAHLARLTDRHEAGRDRPWSVDDAPADYIDKLLAAIVGIEIPLTRLEGKWKASQNRSPADRAAIAAGLDGHPMAALVRSA